MIPIRDDNPTRRFAIVTAALIAVNAAAFLYTASLPPHLAQEMVFRRGLVPDAATKLPHFGPPAMVPGLLPFLTSMFLHGDLMHLAGNMLFLWIFGNNVEDTLGRLRFVFFYLSCGVAASLTQIAAMPRSAVPMIGASGAIAGILGAYFLLFPRARILTLVPFLFIYFVKLPAYVVLGMWLVYQMLYSAMSTGTPGGGVAWFAHVGGFVAGMLLLPIFRPKRRPVSASPDGWPF